MSLLSRREVDPQDTWDLTPLYPSDEAWCSDYERVRGLLPEASAFQGAACASPQSLAAALEWRVNAQRSVDRLLTYGSLRADEDLSVPETSEMVQKASSLEARLTEATAFLDPEILRVPPGIMDPWLREPVLEPYLVLLNHILRARPHTLTEPEERLLAGVSEVTLSFQNAAGKLTDLEVAARLPEVTDGSGRSIRLTHGNFVPLLTESPLPVRRRVHQGFYRELSGNIATLAALLEGQVRTHVFLARARNFPSSMEASLFHDQVEGGVYRALITTVEENLHTLHRYYHLKRRVLQQNLLGMHDVHAPILPGTGRRYTFEEAAEMILKAVSPLGKDYVSVLEEGFRNRWTDRYENVGKRSGAYSGGCYDSPPYMLMNYSGTLASVFTLAHEAGHSMHSHLSRTHRAYQESSYPILLAEVASITHEILLFEYLLQTLSGRDERAAMLDYHVNAFRTTFFRQTQFARFELLIHEHVENGGVLTPDTLSENYETLVRTYHGDAFHWDESDGMIRWEWARIPHFFYNFYVYKYATGMAAAVCAGESLLRGDPDFTRKYLAFLSEGGRTPPLEQLLRLGIDLEGSEPIRRAVARFDRTLAGLEGILGQEAP